MSESSSVLKQFFKKLLIKKQNKKEKDVDKDPLLLIEWDHLGLAAKALQNAANTNIAIVNLIQSQQDYAQFPPGAGIPSDCAFAFNNAEGNAAIQNLDNSVGALLVISRNWAKYNATMPDLGRVYQIEIPEKGQFQVVEHTFVIIWYVNNLFINNLESINV